MNGAKVLQSATSFQTIAYYGELIHVEGEMPNNDREFVSVFSVSGQIYTMPQTDTVIYLCLTTDWMEHTVVVFDIVESEI